MKNRIFVLVKTMVHLLVDQYSKTEFSTDNRFLFPPLALVVGISQTCSHQSSHIGLILFCRNNGQ
jgi:hypothetical protein